MAVVGRSRGIFLFSPRFFGIMNTYYISTESEWSMTMDVFQWDDRLGIALPQLNQPWEAYSRHEQVDILGRWEIIRGQIPNRIFALERQINALQAELNVEVDFVRACRLNRDIAEMASIINDLQIWSRADEEVAVERAHR